MSPAFLKRRGLIMIVVLIALAMMSMIAMSFADAMLAERIISQRHQRQSRLTFLLHSGFQYAAAHHTSELVRFDEPARAWPDRVTLDSGSGDPGAFQILHPSSAEANRPIPGMVDESARLNINALAEAPIEEARERLMAIPEMTLPLADAILDFIDPDDQPRPLGAESSYYQSIHPDGHAPNQPLGSIDELRSVRGITDQLLYGEDVNQNRWLDLNENDGAQSFPEDNQDGKLQAGLSEFLTVYSDRTSLRPDGSHKIHVNQPSVSKLYDELVREFGTRQAQFLVAFRMQGSLQREQEDSGLDRRNATQRIMDAQRRARVQLGLEEETVHPDEGLQRGGMELSKPAFHIRSFIDLFGVSIRVVIDGKDQVIDSPWSSLPEAIEMVLPQLQTRLTLRSAKALPPRINPAYASLPVLLSVPGIDKPLASSILRYRSRKDIPDVRQYKTIAWLRNISLVDQSKLRALAPYLTARGAVSSVHVLAFYPKQSDASRFAHAFVDSRVHPARILMFQTFNARWPFPVDRPSAHRHIGATRIDALLLPE